MVGFDKLGKISGFLDLVQGQNIGRKKWEPQHIGGDSSHLKVTISCHTRNRMNFFQYCIKGLYIAAFWTFQFPTTIAVIESTNNALDILRVRLFLTVAA